MDSKPFWQSKTLWVNVLSGAATLVTYVGVMPEVQSSPTVLAVIAFVSAGVNLLLRLMTKTTLTAKPVGSPPPQ